MKTLKTLVMMQLKDKLDLAFVKNKRSLTLKIVLEIIKLVAITAVFFALFYVSVMFSVFSFSLVLPDTVVNIVFTLIQLMAIVSCTIGLSNALYLSKDNSVLLTLPATNSQIFVSKLLLFYIFELKRNLSLTLPLFVAYGITNGAVWYYYIWLIPCFALISFVPVVIGALLSMPALYIGSFVRRYKWLQYTLMLIMSAGVIAVLIILINMIPTNINILGQWGTISGQIQYFLRMFSRVFAPFYWLCLLAIGGTVRISNKLFGLDTLWYLLGTLGAIAIIFGIVFLLARPLFFKMASSQFEYEKLTVAPKKNKVHPKQISPFLESFTMDFRSSRHIILVVVEMALPAVTILFLNRIYSAMNTSLAGQSLTRLFNILVLLVILLSFNSPYASVYSKEANARNILKTRPENPLRTLFARISFRAITIVLSTVAAVVVYGVVGESTTNRLVLLALSCTFLVLSHLLWCAEIDVMKSQADQYQTIGLDFDNPNERNATIIGMVLAILYLVFYNLLSDYGATSALIKLTLICAVLLVARIYLYVKRVNLYFVEN